MSPVVLSSTPAQLAVYRSRHVIARRMQDGVPVDECAVDGLRLVPRNGMTRTHGRPTLLWRHDPDAIRALARQERGEP